MLAELHDWPLWRICQTPISEQQVTPLAGGLTNRCYLLTLNEGQFVLRISGDNSRALDLQRRHEYRIHQHMAELNIAPRIRYCAPNHRYWVRDYTPGKALTPNDLSLTMLRRQMAVLKTVHQTALEAIPTLSITAKAEHYWNMLANHPDMTELCTHKQALQQYFGEPTCTTPVLCHMDPTAANWVLTEDDQIWLLDWEYAARSHPLLDMAALFSQASLTPNEELTLLAETDYDLRDWPKVRAQLQYLEALWYGAQMLWSPTQVLQTLKSLLP